MSVPVPKLRFKNFSQALINGPFEQYIKSSKYGPRFDANDYDLNGNVKTIRGTDVALDATIKYEQVPIANLPQKLIDEHQLHEGDILMITTADCGLSAVFEKQEIPFIASAYAVRIVLKNSLDSLWVKYYLQTQHIVNEVNKYVRKGTLSNLPLSDISKFSFTVPALEEQTKIATFFSAVDEKISQLTQKHQLLSQYKQGMMRKLFSQQLRFKADDGSEFGEWEELALKQLGKSYNGLTGKTKVDFGQGDAFVTYKQIFENRKINLNKVDRVKISPEESQNNVVKGDLFFTTSSETPDEVAYCSAILDDFDYPLYLNSFCFGFRPNNQQQFSSNYASLFFRSDEFRSKILHLAQGSTRYNISKTAFMDVEIKLPCLAEQTKIANFLSAIDQKIEVVAQQIEQAKQWKKGLLQQMFV